MMMGGGCFVVFCGAEGGFVVLGGGFRMIYDDLV